MSPKYKTKAPSKPAASAATNRPGAFMGASLEIEVEEWARDRSILAVNDEETQQAKREPKSRIQSPIPAGRSNGVGLEDRLILEQKLLGVWTEPRDRQEYREQLECIR